MDPEPLADRHSASRPQVAPGLALTGSHGLLGSALLPSLAAEGCRVLRLVRGAAAGPGEAGWSPEQGLADPARLEGLEAVIHLAGANIASGRWSAARKAEIRRSRVEGSRRLAEGLARLARPPRLLISASAVGYYGHRGSEILTEASPAGRGFLPELCQAWEAAAGAAAAAGIRVVHLRFGLILTPAGGALQRLLLPFRLGLGGRIGSGRQFLSWISLDDAVGAVIHALRMEALAGPVNAVAPAPLPNAEFARLLATAVRRPALLPLPAAAVRLALGEMADALLLASTRAVPTRLLATGYRFRHPELAGALAHLLGQAAGRSAG